MCQGRGGMLCAVRAAPGGHPLLSQGVVPPSPRGPPVTGTAAQKRHSHLCFNKSRKGKKPKGLDQDPAMDLSYHGWRTGQVTVFAAQSLEGMGVGTPPAQHCKAGLLPLRFYCW